MEKDNIRLVVRVDKSEKEEVDLILNELGLNQSDLVRLLYKQIIINQGIPFEIKLDRPQKTKCNSLIYTALTGLPE